MSTAISVAVSSSEKLVRDEFAVFEKVETKTVVIEETNNEGRDFAPHKNKAKLFIRLRRHENFEKNIDIREKIRAENQRFEE